MSTLTSNKFHALHSNIGLIRESNPNSIFTNEETDTQGFFLLPSPNVPGRTTDVTGLIIRSINQDGKMEWSDLSLNDLTDVDLSEPVLMNECLCYDGTKWTNVTLSGVGIQNLNGSTLAVQSFATGTSGTDFNIDTNIPLGLHTFNIPDSSSTSRGLLTSADWTIFNNKVSGAAGITGQVQYNNGFNFAASNGFRFNGSDTVTIQSILRLEGSTSGRLSLTVPPTVTDYSIVMPDVQGGVNTFLRNDGSGNLTWEPSSGLPGGVDTQIQFNDSGSFQGSSAFTFDKIDTVSIQSNLNLLGGISGRLQLTVPSNVTDYTVTFPNSQGLPNQILQNDGSGNLSWVSTISTPGGSDTQIQYNDSGSFNASPNFTFDGSTIVTLNDTLQGLEGNNLNIRTIDRTVSGVGDSIVINSGNGNNNNNGGAIAIGCGDGDGTGTGGSFSVLTGSSSGSGDSGFVTMATGNGVNSGQISLVTGSTSGNGNGGNVLIVGADGSGSGNGGGITLSTGNNSSTGLAGDIKLITGENSGDSEVLNGKVEIDGKLNQIITKNPKVLDSFTDGNFSSIQRISIQGDFMFVTMEYFSFQSVVSINISDPTSLSISTTTSAPSSTTLTDLSASGRYLFVIDSSGRFYTFDIPNSLSVLSNISDANLNGALRLSVFGDHAYVVCTTNNSITSVNISDPSNVLVNSALIDATNLNGVTSIDIQNYYAYCVTPNRITIVNINDPSSMNVVGTLTSAQLVSLSTIIVRGSYAYTGGVDRFVIINIQNPISPVIVGSVQDISAFNIMTQITVTGNYAYVVSGNNSIATVDISNKSLPSVISIFTPGVSILNNPLDVKVQGQYMYSLGTDSDTLVTLSLNGVELTSCSVGNIRATDISVDKSVNVGGHLAVASSAQINNSLAVMSDLTVHDNFHVKGHAFFHNLSLEKSDSQQLLDNIIVIEPATYAGMITTNSIKLNALKTYTLHVKNKAVQKDSLVLVTLMDFNNDDKNAIVTVRVSNRQEGSFEILIQNSMTIVCGICKIAYWII